MNPFQLQLQPVDYGDDISSIEDYPIYSVQEFIATRIMVVPDLAMKVCDISDDETLLRLSMCNKYLNNLLTSEKSEVSWRKGYTIRLLKHKYSVASVRLDNI